VLSSPGGGELAATWAKTPAGATERAFQRGLLLFARPWQIPPKWLEDQYRLAQMPNFMEATLASLRANIGVAGQRDVLVDQLPRLTMPTLIVWGVEDRVFPYWQGKEAVSRLQEGSFELLPDCGHLPHVEQPRLFASIVGQFLGEMSSSGDASGSGPIEFEGGRGREEETRRRDRAANNLKRKDHR
jgi:4,5:9,10-diseco-3-hydroxy-5,9,17-trioxoandrosta-1(10),2-diene-4-oate hydrolase